ncbi:MAG: sulfite exporter TauE/SafE family protein [Kofleriaceae bacterium]|nr:sulfite exporter TauE/SafE family protein [Kofleriaceae bacterium]
MVGSAGGGGARARAALLGLLSAALPCGWLWAFVVVAAGTGSPVGGALVMTAFWARHGADDAGGWARGGAAGGAGRLAHARWSPPPC